jgi:hypothetical protein
MMASDKPASVEEHLEDYQKTANALNEGSDKGKRDAALRGISEARKVLKPVDQNAGEAAALSKSTTEPGAFKAREEKVESGEDALKSHLEAIQNALPPSELPETKVFPESGNKADSVTAAPLTKKPGNTKGSRPFQDPPGWSHVGQIDRVKLNPKTEQWGPAYWVRMHLLSEKLHGPGAAWNLVPARKTANTAMLLGPEKDAKTRIANNEVLYYHVQVHFYSDRGPIEKDFPREVNVEWGSMKSVNGVWEKAEKIKSPPLTLDPPSLEIGAPIPISTLGRPGLMTRSFPYELARQIAEESKSGPYADEHNFLSRMNARYAKLARYVDFEAEYWRQVQVLMAFNNLTF